MFFAQIEPAFDATSCSIARRALSVHSLCPLLYAAHLGSPSCMLPKSLYNSLPAGKLLERGSKAFDSFFHCGHQSHTRPIGASISTVQSKSSLCWLVSAQMTKVRLIPVSSSQAYNHLAVVKCHSRAEAARLFLSQELTVLRATPKVRVRPRKLLRSWYARRICSRS
jgi:hypothetical protein